jgi:hypothetical protein
MELRPAMWVYLTILVVTAKRGFEVRRLGVLIEHDRPALAESVKAKSTLWKSDEGIRSIS